MVPNGVEAVADAGVAALLAGRTFVDVPAYERLVRGGEAGGEPPADFAGEFVFAGVRNQRREYARPGALAAGASASPLAPPRAPAIPPGWRRPTPPARA